jgi:serine/threonine-protein kinase
MMGIEGTAERRPARLVGGRYAIVARLGEGGMGSVHLARLVGRSDFVKLAVLKCLKARGDDDDGECRQMFLNEARLAARLNHANIVQTFEAGDDDGLAYLAMEYLEGQTLAAVARKARRTGAAPPLACGVFVVSEVLAALDYAHALTDYDGTPLNIVHRDVSPQNIFVTYQGATKLVDFGIAKAAGAAGETRDGVIKGKAAYMSPEQLHGARDLDRRADLFSVGIVLWEALAGRRFWEGAGGDFEILARLIRRDEFAPPAAVNPAAPPGLSAVCMKALAFDRERRYASAAEFGAALDAAAREAGLLGCARDVARHVSTHFADERERVRRLIETYSRGGGESDGSIPALVPSRDPDTDPSGRSPVSRSDLRELRQIAESELTGRTGLTPSALRAAREQAFAPQPAPPRGRRLARAGFVVAGLAGMFAAGASLAALRGRPPSPSASPPNANPNANAPVAAPRAPDAPAPAPAEPDAGIVLDVTVSPRHSQLFWDDQPIGRGAFHGRFPKDGAAHVLRAEAPGHRPRSFDLLADRDRALDVTLTAEPRARAAPAGAAPKRPDAAPPAAERPAPASAAPGGGAFQELEPAERASARKPQLDTEAFKQP